jgi:hypothetical protein
MYLLDRKKLTSFVVDYNQIKKSKIQETLKPKIQGLLLFRYEKINLEKV